MQTRTTADWLSILEPQDVWCAEVQTWHKLLAHEGFLALDAIQEVRRDDGIEFRTTRCPIHIDGAIYKSEKAAPRVGQHNQEIMDEFNL